MEVVEEEEVVEVAQDEYVVCVGPGLQVQPRRFLSFRLLIFFSSFPFSSSCSQRFLFSSLLWARPSSSSSFPFSFLRRARLNQVQWWPHRRIPYPPLYSSTFFTFSFAPPRTLCRHLLHPSRGGKVTRSPPPPSYEWGRSGPQTR